MSLPFKIRLWSFEHKRPVVSANVQQSCKAQHWRQKMKRTPKMYEAYKKHEATRARLKRTENSLELNQPGNEHLLETERASKAKQMREYRQKQREKQETESTDRRSKPKRQMSKAETQEKEKQRKKWTEQKRCQRAKMTKEKRLQKNNERREKRRNDKEDLIIFRRQQIEHLRGEKEIEEAQAREAELNKHLQEEEKQLGDRCAKLGKERNQGRSSEAKRRSIARVRSAISKEPATFSDTVVDLIHKGSPRKQKMLQEKGICSDRDLPAILTRSIAQQMSQLSRQTCKMIISTMIDLRNRENNL